MDEVEPNRIIQWGINPDSLRPSSTVDRCRYVIDFREAYTGAGRAMGCLSLIEKIIYQEYRDRSYLNSEFKVNIGQVMGPDGHHIRHIVEGYSLKHSSISSIILEQVSSSLEQEGDGTYHARQLGKLYPDISILVLNKVKLGIYKNPKKLFDYLFNRFKHLDYIILLGAL